MIEDKIEKADLYNSSIIFKDEILLNENRINNSTIENIDNEIGNQNSNNDNNNILFATQIYWKNNTDKKLEELLSDLENYKKEVQEYVKYGKNISHYKFRKTILRQIELNLLQIGENKNKEKREESINKLT